MEQREFTSYRCWLALRKPLARIVSKLRVPDVEYPPASKLASQRAKRLQHAVERLTAPQLIIVSNEPLQFFERGSFRCSADEPPTAVHFRQSLF
jgi:hypothetical protein